MLTAEDLHGQGRAGQVEQEGQGSNLDGLAESGTNLVPDSAHEERVP